MTEQDAERLTRLHALIAYDPTTGIFTALTSHSRRKVGSPLGEINPAGRKRICFEGRRQYSNRLAWFYMTGEWPTQDVDHKNRDKGDDRWENLRLATRSQNNANCGRRESRSGIKGVWYRPKARHPWKAFIGFNGKRRNLGSFDTAESAHAAYAEAARAIYGDFSCLG